MLLNKKILDIPGWMKPNELEWLLHTAEHLPINGTIVELGTFCGRSTMALCQGAELVCGTVITVDPFDDAAMRELPEWKTDVPCMYDRFVQTVSELRLYPQVMRMTSLEAAKLIPDNSVDMVFIDGLHTATGEDIDAWRPKMKPGGVMAGHDYGAKEWSVRGQVNARFASTDVTVAGHSIWWTKI